jgi:hypothetical protein
MATDLSISMFGWGRGANWTRKVRGERGRRKGEATLRSFVEHAEKQLAAQQVVRFSDMDLSVLTLLRPSMQPRVLTKSR